MSSLKVPPFSGHCHIQLLPGTAAHAADTAHMLRLMQPSAESPPAPSLAALPTGITARTGDRALWVLLALLLVLAGCKAFRPAPDAEHPTPSKSITTAPAGLHNLTWFYE